MDKNQEDNNGRVDLARTCENRNSAGRPRTKLSDLPENWEIIFAEIGQNGGSATEVRCELGIAGTAWATLMEDYQEFRDAEERREALSRVWWERVGRGMAEGKIHGNAAVWIVNMRNRFGWENRWGDKGSALPDDSSNAPDKMKQLTGEDLRKELERRGLPIALLKDGKPKDESS